MAPTTVAPRARLGRWVLGLAVGAVVLVLLVSRRGELAGTTSRISHLSVPLALLALATEVTSLLCYALAQRRVLATGTRIGLGTLFLITLANDAIALSVPGEPAVSSAYRYREYRRHGAGSALAGWSILTLIVAQAVGMSSLLVVGIAIALLTSAHAPALAATSVFLVVVLGASILLLRRNALVGLLHRLLGVLRRLTGFPRGDLGARVDRLFDDMRAVTMARRGYVTVTALAMAAWLGDAACLVASFLAVHAPIPWRGVLLAYGVAQLLAVLPFTPGGFGIVEGGLAVVLVAYGAPHVTTVAAVLVYRLIAYWLAIAVGWLTVGLLSVRRRASARPPA